MASPLGLDDLNDTQLLVGLMPHLTLPSLLNLCEVSWRWHRLCWDLIPRQTRIEIVGDSGQVTVRRSPTSRLSWEVPSLADHQAPLYMRPDSESQLTVDLEGTNHFIPTQALVQKMTQVVTRMQEQHAQPLQILYLLCMRTSEDPLQDLFAALPSDACKHIHTLCVHYPTFAGYHSLSLFPFNINVSFTSLVTVRLERVGFDMEALTVALPTLTSLYLSNCHPVAPSWTALTSLTKLSHLCLMFSGNSKAHAWPALESVRYLTNLTSIRLVGVPACETCCALMPLTSVKMLCMNTDLASEEVYDFQQALNTLAGRVQLRHLDFSTCLPLGEVMIPVGWTHLESLNVSYCIHVPYLSSLTRLILRRSAMYVRDPPLPPLPRNLVSLQAPYNALCSAVGCDSLRELIWTQATVDFFESHQIGLLLAVSQPGVWPLLDRVLILRDSAGLLTEHAYSGQLLDALAVRPFSIITHVTVQQDTPLIEVLCKMRVLHSITLIDACVTLQGLRTLLKLPNLTLLELIGVHGIDYEELAVLEQEGCLIGITIQYDEKTEVVPVS